MFPSASTGVLATRYRLEHLIAAGGMGEVWRAADLVLGRPVAVKVLRPEYAQHAETLARFRAEARHAAALSHPAIAQVYDYGEADDEQAPYLVMELVDGPALTRELAPGPLPPARALDIIAQVAGGLAAAHAAGVVHRDIKPGNLLVDPAGRVKITDFGIAYAAGSAPLTRTGTLLGTPAYLAPERVGGAAAGPASDLYSLGMVAYECLTGALPFTGTAVEIALAHQNQALPPLPPVVPAGVAALVAHLTARDPAARPGSAAEVAERAAALRAALDDATAEQHATTAYLDLPGGGDGTGPYRESVPAGGYGRARRPRYLAAVIAIVVICSAAGWLLASTLGRAPGPAAQPSQAASRTVAVHADALAGLPVRIVVARLRRLGLRVRVAWVPSHQARGTVLTVRPGGRVARGTTVLVTAARPPGHRPGHDHGHGRGRGDGGNGQGGD